MSCSLCGAPDDDFGGSCTCVFDKPKTVFRGGGMRSMITRRLEKRKANAIVSGATDRASLRVAAGLSQYDVAVKVGLRNQSMVWRYETGQPVGDKTSAKLDALYAGFRGQ